MKWLEMLKTVYRRNKKTPKKPRHLIDVCLTLPNFDILPAKIIYNVDFLRGEKISTPRGHAHTAILMQELLVPKNPSDFYVLLRKGNFEIGLHQQWLYNWLEIRNTKTTSATIVKGNIIIMESILCGNRTVNYEKLNIESDLKYGKDAHNVGLLHNRHIMDNFKNKNLIIRNVVSNSFEHSANYCEYEGPKHTWPRGNNYFRIYVGEEKVFEYQTVFH